MYDSHRTYSRQGEDKEKTQGGGGEERPEAEQREDREQSQVREDVKDGGVPAVPAVPRVKGRKVYNPQYSSTCIQCTVQDIFNNGITV